MCRWGSETLVLVPIPADLSHTGQLRWDVKAVDQCLADLVRRLNAAGMWTASCCCGHGNDPASILLHDGRVITVMDAERLVEESQA